MGRIRPLTRFLFAYVKLNAQAALEYRASLASQVFAMAVNNAVWLLFWVAYFERFPQPNGWGKAQVMTLWAVLTASYGWVSALTGNVFRLAGMVARGELDFYLTSPKPILGHLLVSRMTLTAPADIAFGALVFGLLLHPSWGAWVRFGLCVGCASVVLLSFALTAHSLSFWLGHSQELAHQLIMSLVSLSTYPTSIFHGWVKLLLFTVIPAGFVTFVPAQLVAQFTWGRFGALLGFSAFALSASCVVFYTGLRRYTSGSILVANG